jgi:hypothetical protein
VASGFLAAKVAAFVCVTGLAASVSAQVPASSEASTTGRTSADGKPMPIQLKVIGVRHKGGAREVRLSETIVVTVERLSDWIAASPSTNDPHQFSCTSTAGPCPAARRRRWGKEAATSSSI